MTNEEVEKLKKDFWEKIRPPKTISEQLAERAAEYIDGEIIKKCNYWKDQIRKCRPELTEEEIDKAIDEALK